MKVIILGAGGRGNVYAKYFSENGVEIAGLADPNTERLHKVANSNGIPEASLYHSWEEVLEKPKFADAVVNATTDHLHYKSTMKAIERGYHILIEKPISPSENECIEMVEAAERKNLIFAVCHVLRYAPFFEKIKELVENGAVGDILNFQLTENVGYWHFAHSFVRGVFRNEKVSSPMILAKSCHDLDIISYIMNKKCVSVMSDGGLTHFVHANKPEGAPTHCLDGCPHEKSCPYFAPKLYLTQITDVSWPTTAVTTDTSFAGRYAALQTGQYGRCVYQCDNDVADHQSAVFTMHYTASEQSVSDINPGIAAAVAREFSDIVVGVKSAHYWAKPEDAAHPTWASIDGAREAAQLCRKLVMVDSIPIAGERPYPEILARLAPGDVHTHVFAQQFPLMDAEGKMQPYMLEQRARGVRFDVGHGSGSFWFRQAVGCFEQGFWPDTISTDLHHQNVTGPAIDLLYVASKFLAMGMPLTDVLYRVTRAPALVLRHPELGTLETGACADIAVLRRREGPFGFMDCGGARLTGDGKLECVATLRAGEVVFDPEARSMPDWRSAPEAYWKAPGLLRGWTLWK